MKVIAPLAGLLLAMSSAAAFAQTAAPAPAPSAPAVAAPATPAPAADAAAKPREFPILRPIEMMLTLQAGALTFDGKILTLTDVAPTSAFSIDRPERIGGTMTLEQYGKLWNATVSQLKNDPPNVSLTTLGPVPTQAIVEVGTVNVEGNKLTANAVVLDGVLPPSGQLVSVTTAPTIFRPLAEVREFLKCWWSPYWMQRVCRAAW
ncbi:hypothetical protein GCM10007301_39400 [Azorhizobium oxalatiphilum]|uniref:Uncharacterized protein n=1 Tax=Azorhizobium oxalatiphilum TaxID=980631 RepID=A0A917FGK5_9HYPH|nr:hypothetical protein [Azorhizobium oxalatiphilum]GGF75585.1 hypothetical protein GCM10007301_39400 [Azorhizobium oxalatiphilum]